MIKIKFEFTPQQMKLVEDYAEKWRFRFEEYILKHAGEIKAEYHLMVIGFIPFNFYTVLTMDWLQHIQKQAEQ